jgi:hypothetical protein
LLRRNKKIVNYGKSLTDTGDYVELCHLASWNTEIFSTFRSNTVYNEVLEHATYEQGLEYLKEIPTVECFEEFKKNDLYGSPRLYTYSGIGDISPTTLRYIKVLYDLEREFGSLENYRVFEIGVGYGGQCRLCCSYFNLKEYVLFDLPPVLSLTQRYLYFFPIKTRLRFETLNECSHDEDVDLVVSNYAFTEIKRDIQEVYIEKIIKRSKRGYITYNEISNSKDKAFSFSKEELLSIIPNSAEHPERPLSFPGNCIIIWNNM